MRIQNQKAIIIKTRQFMENDMIVTLLNEKGEKIEAIVKGAQSGTSKRKAHMDLLNLVNATIYQSNRNKYLQAVQATSTFHRAKERFFDVFTLYKILDIINRSIQEEDKFPEIFSLLLETMETLNSKNPHIFTTEIALIKLAHLLGFLPSFRQCGKCHQAGEGEFYLNDTAGTIHCENCKNDYDSPVELKFRKAIEYFRTTSINAAAKLTINEDECERIKQISSGIFRQHLDIKEISLA